MNEDEFKQVERVLLERYGFVKITTKTINTEKPQDDPFPPNYRSQLRNSPVTQGLIHYQTKLFTKILPKDSLGGHRETFFLLKSKSSLYLIIYLYPSSRHKGTFQGHFLSAVKEVITPKLIVTYRLQKREGHEGYVCEFWHSPDSFEHFRRNQLERLQERGEITDLKTNFKKEEKSPT